MNGWLPIQRFLRSPKVIVGDGATIPPTAAAWNNQQPGHKKMMKLLMEHSYLRDQMGGLTHLSNVHAGVLEAVL